MNYELFFPLHYLIFSPIIITMPSRYTAYPQYQPPLTKAQTPAQNILSVSLLQIGGIDARSAQKTPAGVLVVRRGLFFVKRQRRYAAYLQKGLDTPITGGIISQLTAHSSQLTAHSSQLTA